MLIKNCTANDLQQILELYQAARELQENRKMVVWPSFENAFILDEIEEKRQWKILAGSEILCNWVITFNDKEIWGEKDEDNAIYIHRICTNPNFRGNRFIDKIVAWAKIYAGELGRQFIRLDTLGNNTKLIEHYRSSGFNFLGIYRLTNTTKLPKHYQDEPNCCMFQIES